ncbi:MAG TPA: DUF488 domain-containing protein [Candidatus Binatia bacterium]|nr:DUF488 domain-containing protein [Candidatus Binatia bacterium]
MPPTIFTIGHSTQGADELLDRLSAHGVRTLADVRAYPASRRHPQFAREALDEACRERGVRYVWMPGLGGRRRARQPATRHPAWREPGFRNYADYMDTPEFEAAIGDLEALARAGPTAFLCAEGLWWQCHRRLISDALTVRGWDVEHVLPNGSLASHELPDFARVADGHLVYDRGTTGDLELG